MAKSSEGMDQDNEGIVGGQLPEQIPLLESEDRFKAASPTMVENPEPIEDDKG